ncbi:pilus assembly protein PilW [Vibrio anguillarum]|uniref:PilW family protein n=1 Tax=Vibrio TaxID=662 RepID=UPI000B8E7310|nr:MULTISPECIES: pilus assembly protein PilW [Vibrio]MCC4236573.1 pilus assembly protein PilW [Vibrio anguillarum]MDT3847223.1 pilus assembly protein PilW [Vibrio anguillarum]NAX44949.1 pilus assembly protein PilW [Vibrio sp. V25_P4S6T154]NOI04748.1 pilus assembly protein PilW [Vibrio anguillarum]OXX40338.1 pilus assembly protein PilW [Vibrio sp. V17_P4S1T151]
MVLSSAANIPRAKKHAYKVHIAETKQMGATLIEFMVASMLGLIAIAIIGSVFITGQKVATERGKELLLLQQVTGALQYLKQDIQRAGYDGGHGNSLTLLDNDDIVFVSADQSTLAYAYLDDTGATKQIRNVGFVMTSGALGVCDRPTSVISGAKTVSQATAGCSAIFDTNQINVTHFQVQRASLAANGVSSAYMTISMAAELVGDSRVSTSFGVAIKQRNWQ